MNKLNIHRFDDSNKISVDLVSKADVSGFKKATEAAKETKTAIKGVNDTPINIKTDSIFNATSALNVFDAALEKVNKTSSKSNLSSYSSKLQFSRINNFAKQLTAAHNAKGYKVDSSKLNELYKTYEQQQRPIINKMNSTLSSVLGQSLLPQFQSYSTPKTSNVSNVLSNAYKYREPIGAMNGTLSSVLNQQLPQLDTSGITNYRDKVESLNQTVGEMASKTLNDLYNGIKTVDGGLETFGDESKTAGDLFKELLDKMSKTPSIVDKVSKAFNKLDFTQLVNLWRTVRRVTSGLVNAVESAAGYEESLNLYTMALGKYANEAKVWSEMITTKLKLDPSQVMQYTGAFYNLVRGMKVGEEQAYIMAKNLTQLTYDMASYLNISNEAAQAKIQSAMAGQSRAVATVGVATQMASLQELAYSMNINKKVANMTQAEKTYLRYIQLMKSTEHMQGDLGRTMITPANAMRTLKNQVTLLGRAIGQVLTPIIMQAIPYVMALTNVLTKLASALAGKLGYALTDINYDKALSFESADDGISNLNDLADAASKAGKSVQNSLAPFDELNVVMSESSGVGSSSGSGISDLIDPSVWKDTLPQYDMLKNYTGDLVKQAEALEGKVTAIVTILGGFIAGGAIIRLVNFAKDLHDSFKTIHTFVDSLDVKFNGWASRILTAVQAVLLLYSSIKLTNSAVENVSSGNEELADIEIIGSQLASITAGAAVGGKFGGPLGAVVGGLLGELTAIKTAMASANEEISKNMDLYAIGIGQYNYEFGKTLQLVDQFNEKYEASRQLIVKSADAKLEDIGYYEKLYDRLEKIINEDGKILKGHELEADFIVEELNAALGLNIKIRDGQVDGAKKVKKSVEELIVSQKAEIKLEAMRETYRQAILNESKALASLRDAEEAVRAAKEMVIKASDKGKEAQEEAQKAYDEAFQKYTDNYNNYKTIVTDIERWEDAMVEYTKGNYDKVNEIYDNSAKNQRQTFEDAIVGMTNDLNGGPLSEDLITAWGQMGKNDADAFNSALDKIADEGTRTNILENVKKLYDPTTITGHIQSWMSSLDNFINNKLPALEFEVKNPEGIVGKIKNALAKNPIGVNVEATSNSGGILSNLLSGVTNFAKNVLKFKFAATGGMLDSGDLFFANENGVPEYITSVGNKSAVINQNQMVQTLTNAIVAGFQQFGGNRASNVTVYVGDKKLYEGQGEYQNRQNDRYGTTVVRI